jgi:hypothetical protein
MYSAVTETEATVNRGLLKLRRLGSARVAQDKQVDRLDNGSATVGGGSVASHCRKTVVKVLPTQLCEDRITSRSELLRVDRPVRGDGLRDDQ